MDVYCCLPMSDIGLRLCCSLAVTLELIMLDTAFIKSTPHPLRIAWEDSVCLSVRARLSCRMAEGVKVQERGESQPYSHCLGAGKDSMKDGSHCHGQL